MPKNKPKRKRRGKIRISKRAVLKRKDEIEDSVKRAPTRIQSNGIIFKVKVKRKNENKP